jgi:hypothetical protein
MSLPTQEPFPPFPHGMNQRKISKAREGKSKAHICVLNISRDLRRHAAAQINVISPGPVFLWNERFWTVLWSIMCILIDRSAVFQDSVSASSFSSRCFEMGRGFFALSPQG